MSNNISVLACRITLDDKAAPVTEDAAIGLSNTVYELSGRGIYNDSDGAYGYSITWVSGDDYANVSAGDTVSIGGETTTVLTKWSSTKLSVNVVMLSVEEYDFLATITQNSVIRWIQNSHYIDSGTTTSVSSAITSGDDHLILNSVDDLAAGTMIKIMDGAYTEIVTVDHIISHTVYLAHGQLFQYGHSAYLVARIGDTRYIPGMITEDGISPWIKAIDLSKGGNVSAPGSFSVSVKNTVQLFKTLRAAGIEPVGLKIELVEFVNGTENIRAVGKIRSISFDVESYNIEAEGSYNDRDTAVTSKNKEGETIPIALGSQLLVKPVMVSRPIRIKSGDLPYSYDPLSDSEKLNNQFVVLEYTGTGAPYLEIQCSENSLWTFSDEQFAILSSFFVGKYIEIVDGSAAGQVRRITQLYSTTDHNRVKVKLSAYLSGVSSDSEMVGKFLFIYDSIPTLWIDSLPLKTISGEVYCYTDSDYFLLRNVDSDGVANTKLKINSDFSENGIDSFSSFVNITEAFSEIKTDRAGLIGHSGFTLRGNGIYSADSKEVGTCSGDASNFTELLSGVHSDCNIIRAFSIEMPKPILPNSIKINKCYLFSDDSFEFIDGTYFYGKNVSGSAEVVKKYYLGNSAPISIAESFTWSNTSIHNSFLSFECLFNNYDYYSSFLQKLKTTASDIVTFQSYKYFDLSVSSNDEYDRIKSFFINVILDISFGRSGDTTIGLKYYDTVNHGIIVSADAAFDDIYTLVDGRVFNDTWGSRKTAASLMVSPIDFLEHFLRLANWSEIDPVPSTGWGTAYSPSAKIKTSGTGSFDSTLRGLDTLRAWSLCWANYDYDAARVLEIAKEICTQFDLMLWVDKDGYYCIDRYKPSLTMTGLPKITLANIPADERKNISVEYPQPSDIYCEPVINYNWDEGAQKFQSRLAITNSSAETYSSTYVTGITDAALAERLWNLCHLLWKRARMVTEMPSELSDCKWFNGTNAYDAAVERLQNCINQQFYPTINQVIDLDQAIDWTECTRFVANYPHQTDGVDVECLVEEIECNRAEMKASIKAKMIQYSTTKTFSAVPLSSPSVGVVRLSQTDIEDSFVVGQQLTLSAVGGHTVYNLDLTKPYYVKAIGSGYIDIKDNSGFSWDVNIALGTVAGTVYDLYSDPAHDEWSDGYLGQANFGAVHCDITLAGVTSHVTALSNTHFGMGAPAGNYQGFNVAAGGGTPPYGLSATNVNVEFSRLSSNTGAQVNITTRY